MQRLIVFCLFFQFFTQSRAAAFENILQLASEDGSEILRLECQEKGKILSCIRSHVIIEREGNNCKLKNRLLNFTYTKQKDNLWTTELPVRVDTLSKVGPHWIYTEKERVDKDHPNPLMGDQ